MGEGGVNNRTTIVQFQLGVDQAISWFGFKPLIFIGLISACPEYKQTWQANKQNQGNFLNFFHIKITMNGHMFVRFIH